MHSDWNAFISSYLQYMMLRVRFTTENSTVRTFEALWVLRVMNIHGGKNGVSETTDNTTNTPCYLRLSTVPTLRHPAGQTALPVMVGYARCAMSVRRHQAAHRRFALWSVEEGCIANVTGPPSAVSAVLVTEYVFLTVLSRGSLRGRKRPCDEPFLRSVKSA